MPSSQEMYGSLGPHGLNMKHNKTNCIVHYLHSVHETKPTFAANGMIVRPAPRTSLQIHRSKKYEKLLIALSTQTT